MTQKEKELLLKDLCARLPYGVVCKISYTFNNETTNWEDVESTCDDIITKINFNTKEVFSDWLSEYSSIDDVKPHLRPMSSMIEEEMEHLESICDGFESDDDGNLFHTMFIVVNGTPVKINMEAIDWLNLHHFDYRGLIEKGLAIEVTEENNPYK